MEPKQEGTCGVVPIRKSWSGSRFGGDGSLVLEDDGRVWWAALQLLLGYHPFQFTMYSLCAKQS
jgi:hypothetical protein